MAVSSHKHEHVRGGFKKAFLSRFLSYGIQLNTYLYVFVVLYVFVLCTYLSFKILGSDFGYCLETEMGRRH